METYIFTPYDADRSFKEFYIAVDKITRTYNSKGYRISRVDCDREFKPMMDPVNDDMDLKMFYPPRGTMCRKLSETTVSSRNAYSFNTTGSHTPSSRERCGRDWWFP